MKKCILLCFLCFCLYGMSQAQIYIKGYTGYALSTGNEKLTTTEVINGKEYASSYHLKSGQGVNLGLSMGYALNKNTAFEITGNTQLFSTFNYSKSFADLNSFGSSYSYSAMGFFGDLKYSTTIFQVSPQIVFKSNPYNQWTFYLKGGPDFIWAKLKTTEIDNYFHISDTYKYSGNMNTGIQCSFGTEYKLSKTVYVFAELTTVNVNYTFSDGDDMHLIFNHVGLNAGIKYILRKKK